MSFGLLQEKIFLNFINSLSSIHFFPCDISNDESK